MFAVLHRSSRRTLVASLLVLAVALSLAAAPPASAAPASVGAVGGNCDSLRVACLVPGRSGASWRDHFDNFNAVESDDPSGAAPSTVRAINDTTWRVTKPLGRKRAELSRARGWSPEEGRTYYLKWRWTVRSTTPMPGGAAVFQWKTDAGGDPNSSKQNYPFNLTYDGTALSVNAYDPGYPNWTASRSINDRKTVVWKKPVARNRPVDLVIGVKVSRDAAKGAIELWVDGKKQTLAGGTTRYAHRTNDGAVVYPKWGAYGGASRAFPVVVDIANLRIDQGRP